MIVPLLETLEVGVDCTPPLTGNLVLAPGGVVLCSATLELTQDDVDGGGLSSEVFARGEARDGQAVLAEDRVEQELEQAVGLSVGATTQDLLLGTGFSVLCVVYTDPYFV